MIEVHTVNAGLRVRFDHPSLKFTITCCVENPLAALPSLGKQYTSSTKVIANSVQSDVHSTTCLLTPMPPPTQSRERVTLHRGFNVVSICLLLASSLVGSSLLAGPMWQDGQEICPGVQVVSGPIDLTTVPSSLSLESPHIAGILVPQDNNSLSDVLSFLQTFHTTVVIRSNRNKVSLPFNANMGFVRSKNSEDEQVFTEAANHTADQLARSWLQFSQSELTNDSCFSPQQDSSHDSSFHSRQDSSNQGSLNCMHTKTSHPHAPPSWQLHAQTAEMAQAGLDSSLLHPLLSEPDLDHPDALPPTGGVYLDPLSDEYFDKLVKALELDGPSYAKVDPNIMDHPEAFHLPGTPLGTIKGFYHNIDTGDSPPVYQLPYRKSPSKMCAIKNELQRMLSMNIIQPSHSPYGSPCIVVRKPLEKGQPQPPRFAVDYRRLNSVTLGDGYSIPSVSNILDALSGGKLFAKLDLASGYWQVPVNPKHVHKTAFATHLGLFKFCRMPYGLKTAPQTFQRILNTVFSQFLYQWLIVYIDDCVIWSSSEQEALVQYKKILETVTKFGLQFKPTKCFSFQITWRY